MSQNTDPWIGRQVGRYTLSQRLGSGGSGAVYAAWDEMLEREVALKLLLMLPGATTEMIERFQQEAKLTARLNHANIVPIYDIGEDAGVLYIAMRRLSGATLRDQLNDQGRLSQADSIQIAIALAEALGYAHENNIVHRDIKPANVLFDEGGRPMLVDFGIAKALDMRGKGLTLTGTTIGTPPYMSPEQASGEELNHRSDIYSLGILLYHMLAGRPPFQGNAPTVMQAHLFQAPVPPRRFRPDLNPELEKVILKALAKKPHERFQSASEMAQALNAILQGQPTHILVPPSATQPAAPTRVANPPSYTGPRQPADYPSQRQPIAPAPSGSTPSPRPGQATRQSRGVPIWSLTILMLLLLCSIGAIITGGYYFSDFGGGNPTEVVAVPAPPTLTLLVQEPTDVPIPATETAQAPEPPQEEPTSTLLPSEEPTVEEVPSPIPTETVADIPTETATEAPTEVPTEAPTEVPTEAATEVPIEAPTEVAPQTPTELPTQTPTELPTQTPTELPTQTPTELPTQTPTQTPVPTELPTQTPVPTELPTETPTEVPTQTPTKVPTEVPSPTATEVPPAATATAEPINTPIGSILSCPIQPDGAFLGFFDAISMGCMQEEAVLANGTYQQFANGFMIHDQRADQNFIYVFDQGSDRWEAYPSTWQEGDDEFSCPQAGAAEGPRDAIGLLWCENVAIQASLGNITSTVIEGQFVFQRAEKALLIYIEELPARIALFFANKGIASDAPSALIGYPAP